MKKSAVKRKSGAILPVPVEPTPKEQVAANVTAATQAGRWLIAAFRVEGEVLRLDRVAVNFPKADVDLACRLFVENIQQLKGGSEEN